MKTIIINWKWLTISPLEAEEEIEDSFTEEFTQTILTEKEGEQLIILNFEREEAEFEDEFDHYDERNQALADWLHTHSEHELLLFLHKNHPHNYEQYDVDWFINKLPNAQVHLFGGGEDVIYDLHNPEFGLLDQVGNFSLKALADGKLKSLVFNQLWDHYSKPTQHSFSDIYHPFNELMTALLPEGKGNAAATNIAQQILTQQPSWLTAKIKSNLEKLSAADENFDWVELRESFEQAIT